MAIGFNKDGDMKTISVKKLKRANACRNQVELFERTFGQSARITKANCLKAASVGLSIRWAATHLLNTPKWKAYDEADKAARKVYKEADKAAWKAYINAGMYAVWKTARAYNEAKLAAWKAYMEAKAIAFYEACK